LKVIEVETLMISATERNLQANFADVMPFILHQETVMMQY